MKAVAVEAVALLGGAEAAAEAAAAAAVAAVAAVAVAHEHEINEVPQAPANVFCHGGRPALFHKHKLASSKTAPNSKDLKAKRMTAPLCAEPHRPWLLHRGRVGLVGSAMGSVFGRRLKPAGQGVRSIPPPAV